MTHGAPLVCFWPDLECDHFYQWLLFISLSLVPFQSGLTAWNTHPFIGVLPQVCVLYRPLVQPRLSRAGSFLTGTWTRQSYSSLDLCILCVCFWGLHICPCYLVFHWPLWQVPLTYFILSLGAPVSFQHELLFRQDSLSSNLATEFLNLNVRFYIYLHYEPFCRVGLWRSCCITIVHSASLFCLLLLGQL